jgi:hypothetical protein
MKVLGIFGLLWFAAGPGQAATSTQCATSEQVVFSCAVGNKVVSVCASGDLAQHSGSLSYRFGPLGRPEISYPSPGESRDVVKAGRWVFAGGGGAWLAFSFPVSLHLYSPSAAAGTEPEARASGRHGEGSPA